MTSSRSRLAPFVLAALLGGAAAAAPPTPPGGPSEEARRALAERDVPFEAQAFVSAAGEGDLALVELFLAAGMPASTRDAWGTSALLEAARNDRADVLARLLAGGAKPGEAQGGEPPLTGAAEAGSLAALRVLLAAGADPDQPADPEKGPGGTPLQRACAAESWAAARLLVEAGANPSRAAPPLAPPLVLASESGHAPTVSLLLSSGADPNARGAGGATPLRLAAWNGHVEAVRILLVGGANVAAERAALLNGRPGQPLKPEIRSLLRNPPKAKPPAARKTPAPAVRPTAPAARHGALAGGAGPARGRAVPRLRARRRTAA